MLSGTLYTISCVPLVVYTEEDIGIYNFFMSICYVTSITDRLEYYGATA